MAKKQKENDRDHSGKSEVAQEHDLMLYISVDAGIETGAGIFVPRSLHVFWLEPGGFTKRHEVWLVVHDEIRKPCQKAGVLYGRA